MSRVENFKEKLTYRNESFGVGEKMTPELSMSAVDDKKLSDLIPNRLSEDQKRDERFAAEITENTLNKWYVKYPLKISSIGLFVGITVLGKGTVLAILGGFSAFAVLFFGVPFAIYAYNAKKQRLW